MLYRYSQKLLNCYVYALDEFLVKTYCSIKEKCLFHFALVKCEARFCRNKFSIDFLLFCILVLIFR